MTQTMDLDGGELIHGALKSIRDEGLPMKTILMNSLETRAKEIYVADGFNYACLPTEEAWRRDREEVRQRYLRRAWEELAHAKI